jgi:glycine/D-amino acid oxidase-like deaminating enzyme
MPPTNRRSAKPEDDAEIRAKHAAYAEREKEQLRKLGPEAAYRVDNPGISAQGEYLRDEGRMAPSDLAKAYAKSVADKEAEAKRQAYLKAIADQAPDETDAYMQALQRSAVDRELRRSGGRGGSFGGRY